MFRVATTAQGGLIRSVRHYFGLSQPDLAPFLGVSQAELARFENGLRPLPSRVACPLALLTACLPPADAAPPAAPDPATLPHLAVPPLPLLAPPHPLDPVDAAALLARQRHCAAQAAKLRFQLTQLIERAAQARRRLAAMPALQAAVGSPPVDPPTPRAGRDHEQQVLWLKIFENEARIVLANSGATAQTLLLLRLSALEHEVAHATFLLEFSGDADENRAFLR